ncbi:MAG: outer membrane protein transport protein [Kiritimatiellia bacterium]
MSPRKIKNLPALTAACVAAAILLCGTAIKANEANYQQYVVGDRAAGMGGAGAALGTALDAAYYNPAGMAFTKQRTISIAASLYGWQRYRSEGALYPSEDLYTSSFVTVPPAMGLVFFAEPKTAIGLGAFVPYNYSMSDILAFPKDNNYYNVSLSDQTLWIGPSVAHAFSDQFSVGLGVYGVYRNVNNLKTVYLDSVSYAGTENIRYKTFGLLANLGIQYRPTDHWRLGIAAQCPTFDLWGNGEYQGNVSAFESGQFYKDFGHADNMEARNRIPAQFKAGIGWEKEKSYGFGLDVTWHLANSFNRLDGTFDESGEQVYAEYVNRAVVDANLGAEYYISSVYPIRAGFYTSRSAAPDVELVNEEKGFPGQLNDYGITASIGRELENVMMSLGVNYVFGKGDDYGYSLDTAKNEVYRSITTAKESQFYIFFNTSYMF